MKELQITVPYRAWGEGSEWEDGQERLMNDLSEALAESGLGDDDDPDHDEDGVRYCLAGDDLNAIAELASDVLIRNGVLEYASAQIVDSSADDPLGTAQDVTLPKRLV